MAVAVEPVEKDVGRQLLESLNISRADVKPTHLKLRMGPRSLEGTPARVKFCVAFGEPDHRFARLCHRCDERKLEPLVRENGDIPAHTENRIENSAGPAR